MADQQALFGIHAVESVIAHSPQNILQAWVSSERRDQALDKLVSALTQQGVNLQWVDKKRLDRLSHSGNHQGIVIEVKLPSERDEQALKRAFQDLSEQAFYLVLDQVTDPHNLGACLRTAEAAGVQGVIVPKDNACRLNATVCKVASGAAERVPVYRVTNLTRTIKSLKDAGVWLVGAAGEAEQSLYDSDLRGPTAIVMGAEGKGLRRLTREQCDFLVNIPMQGQIESLNVSVASALMLYEAVRQRNFLSN